jgi:hypothetical protein
MTNLISKDQVYPKMEKLNNALVEMDTMVKSNFINNRKENSLEVYIECLDGGHYEDVTLTLKFLNPTSIHLPCYYYGTFLVNKCSRVEHKVIVPLSTYDEYQECYHLQVKPGSTEFYVQCDELEWGLSGNSGFIKNSDELKERF